MPSLLRFIVQRIVLPPVPRFLLLIGILTAATFGVLRGFRLLEKTSLEFKAPTNSDAELAENMLFRYFPMVAGEAAATTVIIKSISPHHGDRHRVKNNTQHSGDDDGKGINIIHDPQVHAFEDGFESLLKYDFGENLVYVSYASLKRSGLDYLAEQMVNNLTNPTTLTIRLGLKRLPDNDPNFSSKTFADLVDDAIELLGYNGHLPRQSYFVASTGAAVFSRDVRATTENDLLFIDGATFPVAMITLALVLRSFRLLVLPVLCIFCVICISFLIMHELSEQGLVKVTTLVPSIMMSSSVGFSIDYSLFLLSRFREELRLAKDRALEEAQFGNNQGLRTIQHLDIVRHAVIHSFEYAGHTIVVSGLTLAFCWFVLVTFPVSIVSSVGIGAGITTTVCVMVNLMLSPILILTFPSFFTTELSFFSLLGLANFRKRFLRRLRRSFRLMFCCCCGWPSTTSRLVRFQSSFSPSLAQPSGVTVNRILDENENTQVTMRQPLLLDVDSRSSMSSSSMSSVSAVVPSSTTGAVVVGELKAKDLTSQDEDEEAQQQHLLLPIRLTDVVDEVNNRMRGGNDNGQLVIRDDALLTSSIEYRSSISGRDEGTLYDNTDNDSALSGSRPPSRPPIVMIENSSQVRDEMQFVEASAKRTFRVARFVTSSKRKSCLIVILVTLLLVPFGYFAWHYDHSDSFLLTIPRSKMGTKAYQLMTEEFGQGKLMPYSLLIVPRNRTVDADEITRTTTEVSLSSSRHPVSDSISGKNHHMGALFRFIQQRVVREILLVNKGTKDDHLSIVNSVDIASIQSIVWLFDRPISYNEYQMCMRTVSQAISHACRTLTVLKKETYSPTSGAILLKIELKMEPNSLRGRTWLHDTRQALKELANESEFVEFYLAQGASVSLDVVDSVYEQFPKAIAYTASVVLFLDALAFQSVVVPIRALFSIAATLCFVYGSAVLVYQHGLLEWTQIKGLQSPTREIFWVSPIMLFGVLCGISLDYDTFTLTRIVEYRTVGFSETDSVRAGLASSFKIVTTAGFIMTIAFCGLLFSDLPVLNQISFFLVTAVLFDTFVVRMFYVPSMMILLGHYNWFPRKEVAKFETQS